MTGSLEKDVSDILTGTHAKGSGEVALILERVKAEIPKVEAELNACEAAESDIAITGPALEEAIQRAAATRRHLNRLNGSVPRLAAMCEDLMIAERDERQKAEYALLVKQRSACKSEIAELHERIPSFARLLHRVVGLEKAARRFNHPPKANPQMPVNPMDDMVSQYPHLPPLMSDAALRGLRLVDAAGTALYAHVETPVSQPPTTVPAPVKAERCAREKEVWRRASEQQRHAEVILRGLENAAEGGGLGVEQAAVIRGHTEADVAAWREQAEGKAVSQAWESLMAALEAVAQAEEKAKLSTS